MLFSHGVHQGLRQGRPDAMTLVTTPYRRRQYPAHLRVMPIAGAEAVANNLPPCFGHKAGIWVQMGNHLDEVWAVAIA